MQYMKIAILHAESPFSDAFYKGIEAKLQDHTLLKWEAGQMVSHLTPDKLTTLELAALIAVLHAAHARVLGGPSSSRPTLSIITGNNGRCNIIKADLVKKIVNGFTNGVS